MVELEQLILRVQELEPLPASTLRLAVLAGNPQVDLDEVVEVIAYDQALTMRLLRAANSAASGGATRVTCARDAVFRLGTARVLALSIASQVNSFLKSASPAYGLKEGALWKHSIAAAIAAECLPEFALEELPSETFSAALLHDVGKLIMNRYLGSDDLDWLQRAQREGGLNRLEAESQVLQVHHGELGGIIAQRWGLPDRIVRGIIYHHNPADGLDVVCDAVYLANLLARPLEGLELPKVEPELLERLGVEESQLPQLATAAQSRFRTLSARYNA